MLNHFLREVKDHQHHIASKEIDHVNRQDLIHRAIIQDDTRLADHECPAAAHPHPVKYTPAVDSIPAEENHTDQDIPARVAHTVKGADNM